MVDDRENQDKRKAMVRAMTFQKNIFIFDLWKVVSGIPDFRLKPVHRSCQKVRIRWWKSVVYCRPCLRFLPLV